MHPANGIPVDSNQARTARQICPAVSLNFSVAKVIAILTVTAGHWYAQTLLWIPVTFGLIVFAFSSGYFTAAIYGPNVQRRQFWSKKLKRLGLRFWLILAFLVVVIALEGKTVLHWHTLVHFMGLSGFLNWAGLPSESGLGLGLWFFTLLLIFYLAYPFLAQAMRTKSAAYGLVIVALLATMYLEESVKVGHELWLTAFGFIAGVAWGAHPPPVSNRVMLLLTIALWSALLLLNLAGFKIWNTFLIASGGIAVAGWLAVTTLPQWVVMRGLAKLEKYVLEIFIVHQYLFFRPTGIDPLNFAVSLVLIIIVSVVLGNIADKLSEHVFVGKHHNNVA